MGSALTSFSTRLIRRSPRWQVIRAGGVVERRQAGRVRRPEDVFRHAGGACVKTGTGLNL